jgi:hypothetical protein
MTVGNSQALQARQRAARVERSETTGIGELGDRSSEGAIENGAGCRPFSSTVVGAIDPGVSPLATICRASSASHLSKNKAGNVQRLPAHKVVEALENYLGCDSSS